MDGKAGYEVADFIAHQASATQRRIVASGKASAPDAIAMTLVTGAGIAAALIVAAMEGEISAQEGIAAFDEAVEEVAFNAEIIDMERGRA